MTGHVHLWDRDLPVRVAANQGGVPLQGTGTNHPLWRGPLECTCGATAWLVDGRREYAVHYRNTEPEPIAEPEPKTARSVCTCWRLRPDGTHGKGCDLHVTEPEPKTWPCMRRQDERHVGKPCVWARRDRPERKAWDRSADFAAKRALVEQPIPYLVAHPEREIATQRSDLGWCSACTHSFVPPQIGPEVAAALSQAWAEGHNLTHHPRRAARQ